MTNAEQLQLLWWWVNPLGLPFPDWVVFLPIRVYLTTVALVLLGHWVERRRRLRRPRATSVFDSYTPEQIRLHNENVAAEEWVAMQEGWA